ncbi:MAG TPA: ABC transporter substrate-binding protein [Nocardioidaceae bacterium]|nr:ABC transporter substrate-binding protein [Nocardioidaceae bacterium]
MTSDMSTTSRPRTRLATLAAVAALLLPLSACGGDPTSTTDSGSGSGDSSTITIGSANFPESELLGEIYAQSLEAEDVEVTRKFNIGARELYLKALDDGSIDLLPEYNGALLAALSPDGVAEDVTTPDEVYTALQKVLPEGIETLPQSAAEDKDTLTVTKETAAKYKLTTIDDLKPVAGQLRVAAGPEFDKRFQGIVGLKEVYGVTFKELKVLDPGGPLTKAALKKGDVQVANIFSTDSAIETDDLVVLEDTKNLFLSQNVLPLIRSSKVDSTVEGALNKVSENLTTEDLTKYLAMVQVDKQDTATVAEKFLTDKGLV